MSRIILHCDMNSFYASVELLDFPELASFPVAVCGNPDKRHGIILAKNEKAKKFGIITGETLWQAQRKCPALKTLKPNMWKYKKMSKTINQIYSSFTDIIEPFSIDESWLDITDSLVFFSQQPEIVEILESKKEFTLLKDISEKKELSTENQFILGIAIGDLVRKIILEKLGLSLSVGVSYNKVFAKMGSEYKKPNATTLISYDNFKELLWPLPIGDLFFVGAKTESSLKKIGISTIGDLANQKPEFIEKKLGKTGVQIHNYATGKDQSPVSHMTEKRKIGSIGNGLTFNRNLTGLDDIKVATLGLSDQVSARLRKHQLKASGVKIDIKDPSFKVISRQKQMVSASNSQEDIYSCALNLILENWEMKNPIRLLTVTGINLIDENTNEQISFWEEDNESREKKESISQAIDSIREKYGDTSMTFGSLINNDLGISGKHHIKDD